MDIKDSLIYAVNNVLPIFKIKPQYQYAVEENLLTSGNQVNVLNSFSHTLQGNIVFSFSNMQTLKIASTLQGTDVSVIDDEMKTAIGEITTLAVNVAMSKFKAIHSIAISPPIFISGENVLLMISRNRTTKLFFQLNGESEMLSIAYCLEQGT